MIASFQHVRPLTRTSFITMLIGLLLIAGALPASAQSPVPAPPIKLIHLYEHTCPAGVDPTAGSVTDAINACPPATPNVAFTLTSQDPSFAPQTHPTDSLGATEWHEIPSTVPYSIQQTVPAGYDNPVVRCQFDMHYDPSFDYSEQTFPAPGGRLDIGIADPSLTGYGDVSCYWFDLPSRPPDTQGEAASQTDIAVAEPSIETQVEISASPEAQAAQGGGTRLDIRVLQCPFHFDAASASVDQLLTTCTQPQHGANFIINGDPASLQATGDLGGVNYQNVPFGTVTIQQQAYASLDPARVFCYTLPLTAPHGPLQMSQEIGFTPDPNAGDAFLVSIDVEPGDAIDCIWFDATITEDDLGTVLLHKYVCANGTNTAGLDLNALLQRCAQPQVAYFQLVDPTGSSILGLRTDANGYVGFIDFGPGSFTMREIAPLGYAPVRILCRSYNADDWNHVVDPYVDQEIVNNSGFAVQIQAHWETECYLFDIEGVNYGYLDIIAESCPVNFNPTPSTPYLTYVQRCYTGVSGAMYFVTGGPDFAQSAISINGVALSLQHVPAGLMDIQSTPPQSYATLKAFCGDAPSGTLPTSWTPFPEGFVRYDVPVDYWIVCKFYYKPITIVTEGEASPASSSTGLEEGDVAPAEEQPAAPEASPATAPSEESTGETSVQDGTAGDGQGSQNESTSGNQGQSGGNQGSSQPPSDVDAPANLSIVAFTCPSGYDLYAKDAIPSGDCPDPAIGIDFAVTGPAGDVQQATSNAGGELAWSGLAPGDSLLQATLPPETDRAFIADCVSNQRTFPVDNPLNPFAYVGPEGQIGITLLPGEALACTWYIVPARQGGSVTGQLFSCPGVTVIKSQCVPGTGPATLTFEPAPGETVSPFDLQFANDGTAHATAAAGTYALTGIPIDACLVESDGFDSSGRLAVTGNTPVEIRVYICGG